MFNKQLSISCLGFALLAIAALPASADFYQYVDTRGITHFTDNIATIPQQYQSQVAMNQPPAPVPGKNHGKNLGLEKLIHDQQMLLEARSALDKKFNRLAAEKEQLEKKREALIGQNDATRYNRMAEEINLKIQQFKKEEKRFIAAVKRYNTAIQPLTAE